MRDDRVARKSSSLGQLAGCLDRFQKCRPCDGPAVPDDLATEDQAIPAEAERMFASRMGATTIEVASSHVAMVSHPDEVTGLITAAADTCATARA